MMRIITIFDDKFRNPLQIGITRKDGDEFTALLHDVLKKHMLEFYGIFDAPVYKQDAPHGDYALDDDGCRVEVGWSWETDLDDPIEYAEEFDWHIKKEKELSK